MGKSLAGDPKLGIGAPDFVKELRTVIYTVSSDKDSHFTGELVKDAVERENIAGLRSNRIRISKISIQSDQQLLFEVLLYGTDEFEEADLDEDRFIASVEFNLPTYGFQQTTSQWRLDIEGLNIDYVDVDGTKEIHAVLRNLSPTSKNAGAAGEVKVDFLCESRA